MNINKTQHPLAFVSTFLPFRPDLSKCTTSLTTSLRPSPPPPLPPPRLHPSLRACAAPPREQAASERFSLRQRRDADKELVMLVGVNITTRKNKQGRIFSMSESLEELSRLADTAGMNVIGVMTQSLASPMPGTYIGTGKVADIRAEMEAHNCKTCLFDVELSPAQQRTLENQFGGEREGIKVLDRTALILDIFAQHAASREGQLQVELALYEYRLPRLTRLWTHLERQSGAGGVGLRGPGETQLECDRRMISTRMAKLKRQLQNVGAHRRRQRDARRAQVGLPVVALIGYTNTGKSTLLNALTGADVLTANALFATLDPTTRRARVQGMKLSPEILVTDTVGFVQNLPTQVVAAFRATLEEVVEADLVVHVVDGSLETEVMMWQMTAVEEVVEEIGGGGKPCVVVVNKADVMDEEKKEKVRELIENRCEWECVMVSAKRARGLDEVGVVIDEVLRDILLHVEVLIPYSRGDLTAAIYEQGCVQGEQFVENGTRLTAKVPRSLCNKLNKFMITEEGERASVEGEWADLAKGRHT